MGQAIGAGDICNALSFWLSLQARTARQVHAWMLINSPGMKGNPALSPNLMFLENTLTFTLNVMFPFWASDQLTASTDGNGNMVICNPKATGPPESHTKTWWLLGSSSTNTPPYSQERVCISQIQKKGFSGWFLDRGGPGTLCRLHTMLSPILLGGGKS